MQNIGSWDISSLKNATGMFNASAMTLNNMDSTLRGWAKLDTAAIPTANILVKDIGVPKHPMCISHFTNIPTANILVKGSCSIKHSRYFAWLGKA
jgi:hypothetical protein